MKRLLALLLCLGLLAVPARAAVPGWAEDAYAALDARGLLTQDRREASGDISRGDFAALLVDAVQAVLPAEELAAYPPKDPSFFDDAVEGDALLYAAAYGGPGGGPAPGPGGHSPEPGAGRQNGVLGPGLLRLPGL